MRKLVTMAWSINNLPQSVIEGKKGRKGVQGRTLKPGASLRIAELCYYV